MEAAIMGRPVIHFDRGDPISYDPLLFMPAFHFRVGNSDELAGPLGVIADWTDREYAEQAQSGAAYVRSFLAPAGTMADVVVDFCGFGAAPAVPASTWMGA